MKFKVWGFAAVAVAIVAGSTVMGSPAARADGSGPTVTSVDRSGSQPVITIDWGQYADAPVGVLESVDGYKLGTPNGMTTVTDDHIEASWYGPRSYRAAACYDQCDADSIAAGRASLVEGPWLRPDVGDISGKSAPTMDVQWSFNGFSVIWKPGTMDDGATMGIYRNGVPVGLASLATLWVHDGGPFTDTAAYTATACYADCAISALASGFAIQTAQGPGPTFHAASPPVPTTSSFYCHDFWSQVGVPMRCRAFVTSAVFATTIPSGSAEFHGDNDEAFPPTSCVLQQGSCDFTFTPGHGSGGTHEIYVSYPGDDTHAGSEAELQETFALRATYTQVFCPARRRGGVASCTVEVDDGSSYDRITPTGQVDINPNVATANGESCALGTDGRCTAELDLSNTPDGSGNPLATYAGDVDHLGSASQPDVFYVPSWGSATAVSCTPTTVFVGRPLSCTATLTNKGTGAVLPDGEIVNFVVNDRALAWCFTSAGSCTAAVNLPPDATGPVTVKGDFNGDADYWGSRGTTDVNVILQPLESATAVSCTPTTVTAGNTLSCTVSVTDRQSSAPVQDGSVVVSANAASIGSKTCVVDPAGHCTVSFVPSSAAAGPVTLTAAYQGSDEYQASGGSAQIIVTVPTWLVAKPAIANLVSPTQVMLKLSARLTDALTHMPIVGATVRFTANGTFLCSAVTDSSGTATCSTLTSVAQAAAGYRAFYDGETYRLKASTSGAGVRL